MQDARCKMQDDLRRVHLYFIQILSIYFYNTRKFIMNNISKIVSRQTMSKILAVFAFAAAQIASAANLGTFTANCWNNGAPTTVNVSGQVGDTFTMQGDGAGGLSCTYTSTGGIVTPAAGQLPVGNFTTQVFTILAAGSGQINFTGAEQNTTVNVTATAGSSVAAVPTLSEYGLLLLTTLMAGGMFLMRRKK